MAMLLTRDDRSDLALPARVAMTCMASAVGLLVLACSAGPSPRDAATIDAPAAASSLPTATAAPVVAAEAACSPRAPGELRDMTAATEGPYFLRDPLPDVTDAPLVVFLGGGSGRRSSAMRIWTNYLAKARGIDGFRVVLPYTVKEDEYFSEADRTYRIVDELIRCYGRPSMVHLAGVSNGGVAAFGLAVTKPERFDTVMGAPGVLVPMDAGELAQALRGRAVFNGVGALDEGWKPQVRAMHEALSAAGIRSVYSEFPNQGHTAGANFDGTQLVDFWNSAAAAPRTPRP